MIVKADEASQIYKAGRQKRKIVGKLELMGIGETVLHRHLREDGQVKRKQV